ncbi:uncharacterized protein M421DRAFT_71617, partial [Didymella exigua CBS 183.55]
PAVSALETKRVRFSGTAGFDKHGNAFRAGSSNTTQYVGPPSPDIDSAWESLIAGRYFTITEKEAQQYFGTEYTQYYKDPKMGLDVLHTLHCLNILRKALYPEYYVRHHSNSTFGRYHLEHCVDIIRQSIQCHSDITPIPLRWFSSVNTTFIDSDQVHTCKNFQKVREWATERFNGSLAVYKKTYDGHF